jgi:hypothetical protein
MNWADMDYIEKDELTFFEGIDGNEEYFIQEDYTQLQYMCSTFPDCGILESYIKIE